MSEDTDNNNEELQAIEPVEDIDMSKVEDEIQDLLKDNDGDESETEVMLDSESDDFLADEEDEFANLPDIPGEDDTYL